jgi:hypothetical protein
VSEEGDEGMKMRKREVDPAGNKTRAARTSATSAESKISK